MNAALASSRAFTLLEMLVGIAATGVLMAAIVGSSLTLQRSFYWSADYSAQSLAQLRALDFITRDTRGARSVGVLGTGTVLALEVPDLYSSYDAQGNPTSAPVNPTIVRGQAHYGDPAQPLLITYYLDGESLKRAQTVQATAQTNEHVIATGIRSFQVELLGGGNLVRATVTFLPKFRDSAASETATALSATVAARPMTMKYEDAGIP
jgi:prepilin-type N-terminal cleavage/methylation domain-containing protein